ncbi:MAG: hypothetical protein AAF456_22445 [Planctomycetota bacterium]
MNSIKYTLSLLAAIAAFSVITTSPAPAEAQNNQLAVYEYYVYRDAMHTSGYSYTQRYGPYATQQEAEEMCDYLDDNPGQFTWFYGPSWWEREFVLQAWMHSYNPGFFNWYLYGG